MAKVHIDYIVAQGDGSELDAAKDAKFFSRLGIGQASNDKLKLESTAFIMAAS